MAASFFFTVRSRAPPWLWHRRPSNFLEWESYVHYRQQITEQTSFFVRRFIVHSCESISSPCFPQRIWNFGSSSFFFFIRFTSMLLLTRLPYLIIHEYVHSVGLITLIWNWNTLTPDRVRYLTGPENTEFSVGRCNWQVWHVSASVAVRDEKEKKRSERKTLGGKEVWEMSVLWPCACLRYRVKLCAWLSIRSVCERVPVEQWMSAPALALDA